jgi:cyclophilin family peptidyl-prolyl cis-trans isomerase
MIRLSWLVLALAVCAGLTSPAPAQDKKNPVVVIETSMGDIKVELFQDKAPITVKNFLMYVEAKHYDDTLFHRIIEDFMIQGGGHSAKDNKLKPTKAPIKNESDNGLSNVKGTLAMARTSDPDSATSQFFINVVDNTRLDRKPGAGKEGYCVFGQVVVGIDVVDAIRRVETDANDAPIKPVVIKTVRLMKQ